MQPRVKIWLESDSGAYLLGPGALQLLIAIHQTGSLKAGAKASGLSYRAAWDRLKKAEKGLGFALLERRSGGEGGGSSALTPQAEELVQRYQKFCDHLEADLAKRFDKAFAGWNPQKTGIG
jgi:molybdate transport system regulatory protein